MVVTPAHQAPTGVVLSARRRAELIDWARDTGGVVVEDDYDAEYRYDRQPVGALQGVIPDRVVYHGTMSKSLAPGLRLGWLVLPPDLLESVLTARNATDHMTASLVQATFAEFLDRGDLDRHLRRTRRLYRQRRDAVLDALGRHLPGATVGGASAGLTAYVTLPPGVDSAAVVAARPGGRHRRLPGRRRAHGPRPSGPARWSSATGCTARHRSRTASPAWPRPSPIRR